MRFQRYRVLAVGILAVAGCLNLHSGPLSDGGEVDPVRIGGNGGTASQGGAGGAGKIDAPISMPGSRDDAGGAAPNGANCSDGFHSCGDKCVDSLQVATCGVACDPCPGIAGGEVTCDGNRCGVKCPASKKVCPSTNSCVGTDEACGGTCPAGKNPCNGICVSATDKTACGTSCTVCPTSPNGATICDGTDCALACNAGFHLCGKECKSDTSIDSCGTSCTPCKPAEGGGAACVIGACQATCPSGTTLCRTNGKCQPPAMSCDGTCAMGKHDCNGNCVDNTDVNSCGTTAATACKPCPVSANADATCDGKTCGIKCKAGFRLCDNQCKPDNSPASCGAQCTVCMNPANGGSTCTNGACGVRCNDGFHLCNGTDCAGNSDPNACGTVCQKCGAPANARPICNNGTCDFECTIGRKCNGQCIGDDVPCGTSCPAGRTLCSGRCHPANGLPAEICTNNADDDCDGQVDCKDSNCGNGNSCGGGRVCQGGNCVVPCTEGGGCSDNPDKCKNGRISCASGSPVCSNGTNKCGANTNCNNGTCDACGGANQPCCSSGTSCRDGNTCVSNRCQVPCVCGPCQRCSSNGACEPIQDFTSCSGGECRGGTCVKCGSEESQCCNGRRCDQFTTPGLYCSINDKCQRCGASGQWCCMDRAPACTGTLPCESLTCNVRVPPND